MANATSTSEDKPATLSPQVQGLIAVLLAEIPLLEESLGTILEAEMAAQEIGPAEGRAANCEIYLESLERFGEAAESIGFLGLQQITLSLRENIALLAALPRAFNTTELELLGAWSGYAGAYLSDPFDSAVCNELIAWLTSADWPQPLTAELADELTLLLPNPNLEIIQLDDKGPTRPQTATAELISLELPADVYPDLLNALLQELPGQSQTFSTSIQRLVTGGTMGDLNIAKRTAHTLKGAANTVGIKGLATLTHHLEDILDALSEQQIMPNSELAIALMDASDCLEAMSEALCGLGAPPDSALAVLQTVLDWANRIDCEGTAVAGSAVEFDAASSAATPVVPETSVATPTATVQATIATEAATTESTTKDRLALGLVDELLRLGGESIILGGQVHEQVRRIETQVRSMQAELERLQRLGGELERMIDVRDLGADQQRSQLHAQFDALELDQYNELHSVGRMLVETATDARQIGGIVTGQLLKLDHTILTQGRLQRETQEKVLSARMVPVKTVVPRLQRGVRQTGRLTSKQVNLQVQGDETQVDSEVLNGLIEPLMHILRNAVDHGIEEEARRIATGKAAQGEIKLEFLREGNHLLVRCHDDGAGLNTAAIRQTAEARGMLQPGRTMTEEDIVNLVLQPGFSTRSEVTQTSGRGMGLDVVYAHVLSRGGSLTLSSKAGLGTTTEIQIPVSLISTHAVLAKIRDQVMAIADRGVEQILHGQDGSLRFLGDQAIFQVDQRLYPLQDLENLLRLGPDRRQEPRSATPPILLVRGRAGLTAVRVQTVLSGIDLVVKDLGQYIPHLPGVIGATILGDGTVTPVLDLPELIDNAFASTKTNLAPIYDSQGEKRDPNKATPIVLVVDDSLSARRALAQVMEDSGYRVRSARDGLEAVTIVAEQRPDMVLADMEMPRMNGIELTAHLRAHPGTANLPVIMITSRSTAKHRQQAAAAGVNAYLTKPFSEEELLEQVAILRRST